MEPFHVTIDSHLRFSPQGLPDALLAHLSRALEVRDPDTPGDPPVQLWGTDFEGTIIIPRGFALKLTKGLNSAGFTPVWIDNRAVVPAPAIDLLPFVQQRDYQTKARSRMLSCEQGIYEAPPGSGKTITAASFIAECQQTTIILVDKINIATQWRNRIHDATGFECGLIGDGTWNEKTITVALRQALWSAHTHLDRLEWWRRWGALILDECHAISASTVRDLMQKFPAKYRIGLSATPDRHNWMTMISRSIIGEIFCQTTDRELEEAGVLVRPKIVAIKTPFDFPWNKRADPKVQWTKMLKELKFDSRRNRMFANLCIQQRGHTCLVHTDHKQHAIELAAYAIAKGWPNDCVMMMTGDQNDEERTAVHIRAARGDCIIFSTIGKEALDIPRLDRFFLVFPTKNAAGVKQMVGRLKRTHESKTDVPIVYDFYDHKVSILRDQFGSRRGAYDRDELALEIREAT